VPPGPPELTREEREAAARAEARAAARMARFHLVVLSRIGVIAVWLLLAAVVGLVMAELISHHLLY
jgi:cell division septal protein FtsQ